MKPALIYTTFDNIQDARNITDQLIEAGLAACVNVFDGMESSYMWEGKLERANEVACIIKTSCACEPQLMEKLAKLHPYETPCILSIPTENGHMPYIAWLLGNCNK